MKANILIGIVALVVALALYSVGVWGAFRAKSLRRRDITILWIGLAFDVLATAMMALSIGGLDLTPAGLPHTVLALTAMTGMIVIALLGTMAARGANDALLKSLSRYAIAPWLLWAGVFVWGMIVRAPKH
jgi:uncharacterized repeat protein (TIGR03987 family)